MKGFEKETTCLVVTKGSEGFCKKSEAKTTAAAPAVSPTAAPNSSPAKK